MNEHIIKYLRDALNNLYDPERLRTNPLAKIFGVADKPDAPISMQKTFESLIQSLKPRSGETNRSQKSRIYDLLYSRYIDQFSQKEVADQLGISLRTYQREQQTALEFLAGVLSEKYPTHIIPSGEHTAPVVPEEKNRGDKQISVDEFSWMFSSSVEKVSDLSATLTSVELLLQSIITRYAVDLNLNIASDLPKAAVHPEALLQIMINLLSVGVHQSLKGKLNLTARIKGWQLSIIIDGHPGSSADRTFSSTDRASMDIVSKLVKLANGTIHYKADHVGFYANIQLPSLESLPVLVIDDSADNIKLLQRYLAGTRYQMSSLNQPDQALEWIESTQPQIVILDLMMPKVDGLEILTRLRSNPTTCQIATLVCTILPQEELVLTLGASAFLQKPIMRESLLAVLDRLAASMETNTG